MTNPCYFNVIDLQIGCHINSDSHNKNHANSILTTTPIFPEFGIEFRYINVSIKDLSVFYASLINP